MRHFIGKADPALHPQTGDLRVTYHPAWVISRGRDSRAAGNCRAGVRAYAEEPKGAPLGV
jgi:hypothetical protein